MESPEIALIDRSTNVVMSVIRSILDFAQEQHPEMLCVELAQGERCEVGMLYTAGEIFNRFASSGETEQAGPKWDDFRAAVSLHPAYIRVASEPENTPIAIQFVAILWQLGGRPELAIEAGGYWNLMVQNSTLTDNEIADLNEICQRCNMPFNLDANGLFQVGQP